MPGLLPPEPSYTGNLTERHRAADALAEGKVHAESDPTPGVYRVASFSEGGLAYRVDVGEKSCTCPAAQFQGQTPCKHLAALVLALGVL